MRQRYESALRATGREGIEPVLAYLDKCGFYTAPASVRHHLSCPGGLLTHSLNVYDTAMSLRPQVVRMCADGDKALPEDSVAIAALLHDICKANFYRPIQKWRKDANNRWESYEGYEPDYTRFPAGHGEKSVIMLLRLGLQLTNDEILAIRWHMGAWNLPFQSADDKASISAATDRPLTLLLQMADYMATHLLEKEEQTN